jgi:hypothetical protein
MVGPGMFDGMFKAMLLFGVVLGGGLVLAVFGLWHLIAWLAAHLTWS